jgi:hypothetical protein
MLGQYITYAFQALAKVQIVNLHRETLTSRIHCFSWLKFVVISGPHGMKKWFANRDKGIFCS